MLGTKWNSKICKFEKYQNAILEPSNPDSVAVLKKKFGKIFSCFFFSVSLFKKCQPKTSIFDQNRIWFTKKDNNGEQTEEVTLVSESMSGS